MAAPLLAIAEHQGTIIRPVQVSLIPESDGICARDRPAPRRKTVPARPIRHLPTSRGWPRSAQAGTGQNRADLSRVLQKAFWQGAADIGDGPTRNRILQAAGFDAAAPEIRAADGDIQDLSRASRDEAPDARASGLPTFRCAAEFTGGRTDRPSLTVILPARRSDRPMRFDKTVPFAGK